MTDPNPITPPTELIRQWVENWHSSSMNGTTYADKLVYVANQAARWGADAELEACCEWVSQWCGRWPDGTRPEDELRAARRCLPGYCP